MSDILEVVFDIETKTAIPMDREDRLSGLEVSVVCAYRSDTDEFLTFWEDDLVAMEELFLKADRIIGFNSWGFDEPVLQHYFKSQISDMRSIDMLEAVRKSLGTRIKLDILAQATLDVGKTATGLDAVKYWNEGDLESLEKYCKQDVKVTRDLYYKGKESGKIAYFDGMNQKVDFEVNWADGERLPFTEKAGQQSLF